MQAGTRKTTMVLVTHDATLAAMADARLVLRDGRWSRLDRGAPGRGQTP